MKKKLLFFVLILLALAFQISPYARRIRPFISTPSSCQENEIGYNMTSHALVICTNAGYTVLSTGASGSFAPSNATYITQTTNGTLTNEQALSALATGILKNTTTTGILSIAAAGTDFENPLIFTASDFDRVTNTISIDYINGQAASGSLKGFLTSVDWTTFNNKESALTFNSPLSRSVNTISCSTCALTSGNLSQFASTTSAQLFGIISDESGAAGVLLRGNLSSLTTNDVLTWNGTNWINQAVASGGGIGTGNVNMTVANSSSTGTTTNRLAKLTGAPSTALITATSDTENAVGVCTSGCGTTGNATIAILGQVNCDFDGATTAGNFVTISSTTAGKCHDAGSAFPTSGAAYGKVLTTNGASGTFSMELMTPDIAFQNAGNGKSKPGTPSNSFQYNGTGNTFVGGNLFEEDANTLSVRNSTNDQNFSVYRNYVSSSNYQRIRVGWTSGTAEIMSEGSTQAASNVILRVGSTAANGFNFGATTLVPVTDATMTIGSSSNYLSEIYNNSFVTKSGGNIRFVGGSRISGPQKGLIKIIDDDGNSGSGTIQFDSRAYSISADTNNFDGIVPGYFQRWTASGAIRSLTGITYSNSVKSDGQVHLLVNEATNNLIIKNNVSSTAANRFLTVGGNDITLPTDAAAGMIYDSTAQRWRIWPLYNFYSAGTPSIAGNGTLNSGSKDSAGKVTTTATGASTIVLTFSITFARAPACIATNETTANLVRPVSTTTTLTINATIVSGDSISYVCSSY